MKLAHQERLLLLAVLLSAIVLVILGALQVRWSRQVSQAARERIGATLKAAMLDWHLDLLKQLSAPALELSTAIDAHEPVSHYLEEYEEWTEVAPNPDLVSDIFVLQHAAGKNPELLHLNHTTGLVEPADWPANMEQLHQILKSPAHLREQLDRPPAPPPGVRRTDAPNEWLFDPHIPALVYAAGCGEAEAVNPQVNSNCVVIVFNAQVLEKTVLPELAQRYFGSSQGVKYQVAVIGELGGHHAVYSSNANLDEDDFGTAEARMNIFGPRRPPAATAEKPGTSADFRPEATMSSMQRGSWRDFAAPLWFNVIRYSPAESDWYLMVMPLQGSLESMVAQAQRRDLSVGFGVLLLLAISTLMVIVTSRRAQNLARMQMQFISAVSHELRTPLAVMCSAADNLADGVVHGDQQLSQYRSMIASQARQLTALMDQVLTFAASVEQKPQYHLRLLQVSEIIDATVEKAAGLIQDAQFQLEQNVEPGLPPVTGDVDALSHCLQNLIVNAVKYSGESRWIGLRAALGESAGKKEIQISVADRGIGIKGSELNRIFQPFYRSPSVTAAQVHGTGLGLSLAANIAQAMNGRLSVSSTLGEGSVFTLHLPIDSKSLRQDKDKADATPLSLTRS
jgi:two-component system sensor histidine kinase SenX3